MLLLKVTNLASGLRFLQFFCVCQIENIFLIQYLLFTYHYVLKKDIKIVQ